MKFMKALGVLILLKWVVTAIAVTHLFSGSRSALIMMREFHPYVAVADNTAVHKIYNVNLTTPFRREETPQLLPDEGEFVMPVCESCYYVREEGQSEMKSYDSAGLLPQQLFTLKKRKDAPSFVEREKQPGQTQIA